MADEIENLDSPNEELEDEKVETTTEDTPEDTLEDTEDVDALKEKNKQLFARAKKAEGFELKDGEWVKKPKPAPIEQKPAPKAETPDIRAIIREERDKEELDALDLSDELKKEVQTYAKLQNISVKKALTSEYITFRKEKEEQKARAEDASLGGKRKGTAPKDYSTMTAADFDLKTPEGLAEHAKWEEAMRKALG